MPGLWGHSYALSVKKQEQLQIVIEILYMTKAEMKTFWKFDSICFQYNQYCRRVDQMNKLWTIKSKQLDKDDGCLTIFVEKFV